LIFSLWCFAIPLAINLIKPNPPTPIPTIQPTSTPVPYIAPAPIRPVHPAGATALCNDGTYSYSANRRGTCSHHGGVAIWLR
jgi:hypothetical protein